MTERSSGSVPETRDKEPWLVHLLDGEGQREELGSLLATASLVRASSDQAEPPPGAEETSHQRGLAELASLRRQREIEIARAPRAPWFVRFGSAMRFVFTLGRRR
jgi:hypothetical protein